MKVRLEKKKKKTTTFSLFYNFPVPTSDSVPFHFVISIQTDAVIKYFPSSGKFIACLVEESFEWYHSVFCFHHPNCVGPTAHHLFGLVLNHGSHHLKLSKMDDEWLKLNTGFTCFQNSKTEFQWQVGKLDEVVGLFASALSHLEQAKSYYRWSSSSHFHFPFHLQWASSTTEPNNPKHSNPNQPNTDPATPNLANSISTTNPITTNHQPLS